MNLRKTFVCLCSIMLVFCFYAQASALELSPVAKDQYVDFQNKHYGPMYVSFIQQGELGEPQYVSIAILDTGLKIRQKFSQGESQGDRIIEIRHFGGVWEMKISPDATSISSKDVMKEENCLKPNYWGKKE